MDYECTVKADDEEYLGQFTMDDRDEATLESVEGMPRDTAAARFGWTVIIDMEEQAAEQWHEGGRAGAMMAEAEFRRDMDDNRADDMRDLGRDYE